MINLYANGSAAEQTPYFSIVLPIYNVEPYLDQSIQSVLHQSYQDFELILVDDGSTDRSPQICDAYAAQYAQIQVIHKPNGGLSSARNAGTEKARGMYVWWVDSDDWIEPDALTILHEASCTAHPDMVKFHYYRVGSEKQRFSGNAKPGVYEEKESRNQLLDKGFFYPGAFSLSAWGHIYRRDFLVQNDLSFVSERLIGSEDYLFNLVALAVAKRIHVIDDALYSYRQRPGSLTQRYRKDLPEKYTELYRQLTIHYERLGLLDEFRGRICNFYVWHLLHGTCFANEYRITENHTREDGRKNVRQFLKKKELKTAVRNCDVHVFSRAQRIQLQAMRMQIEPLFYWLFVVKPQYKRKKL